VYKVHFPVLNLRAGNSLFGISEELYFIELAQFSIRGEGESWYLMVGENTYVRNDAKISILSALRHAVEYDTHIVYCSRN
jgi:hypothetical protein